MMSASNLFIKPYDEFSKSIEAYLAKTRVLPQAYDTGSFLFAQGDIVKYTYYVDTGLVRLFSNSEGGYSKTLFYHKAKTLIGYHFFRENTQSMFSAVTCTPCSVYLIKHSDMLDLLHSDNETACRMCVYLFDQLELQAREAVNASIYSVLQRFSALLLELVESEDLLAPPIFIPMSVQELAEVLGVHRNSINNSIASLKRSGCIEKMGNSLVIVSVEKLQEIAKGLRTF